MAVGVLTVPCDTGEVSDGYHTFNQLYDHRCLLFVCLMQAFDQRAWYSKLHDNGEEWKGWFIAGMEVSGKQITYHLPEKYWELASSTTVKQLEKAPPWDGHSSDDVIDRLTEALQNGVFKP